MLSYLHKWSYISDYALCFIHILIHKELNPLSSLCRHIKRVQYPCSVPCWKGGRVAATVARISAISHKSCVDGVRKTHCAQFTYLNCGTVILTIVSSSSVVTTSDTIKKWLRYKLPVKLSTGMYTKLDDTSFYYSRLVVKIRQHVS